MREIIAITHQVSHATIGTSSDNKNRFDDLIDFRIGDPDLITDPLISNTALQDAINGYTHYMGNYGDPQLIESLVTFFKEEYNQEYQKENFMITASGSHGMWLALQVTVNPGEEIIVTDPYFDSYVAQIKDAGGIPVFLPLHEKDNWMIDVDTLEKLITPKTKGLILNTPNNPCAVSYPDDLLQKIADIAIKYDLIVYADDIYTIFNYLRPFKPISSLPGMQERTITVRSFSKNFVMTGWRLGCLIAPPEVIIAAGTFNGHIVYSAPSVSQRAAIQALAIRKQVQPAIQNEFKNRSICALERINKIPYMHTGPLDSSIYLWVNIKDSKMNSVDFSKWLLDNVHVAVIPGIAFGKQGEGYVRIALTSNIDKINEAFDRIEKLSI